MSGHFSRKFPICSRFHQFPRISVIIHQFPRNLRDFGHDSNSFLGFSALTTHGKGNLTRHTHTHTHAKADQRKRSNSTTVNYTAIAQLIPSDFFLCNLCVCNLEINSPIFFVRVIAISPIEHYILGIIFKGDILSRRWLVNVYFTDISTPCYLLLASIIVGRLGGEGGGELVGLGASS